MWGDNDMAFARETAEATGSFVSGPYTFHPVEGAGHWLPEERASLVSEALLGHVGSVSR